MRARGEGRGSSSPESADGGDVALGFVLTSCFLTLPDHACLASYRSGCSKRVVRYGRTLRAAKEVVAKTRRNPDEIALHSLRIGSAAALAVGRDISERVIKREGRRRSETYKAYTGNSVEVNRRVWNKPGVVNGVMERQLGEGTAWGRKRLRE